MPIRHTTWPTSPSKITRAHWEEEHELPTPAEIGAAPADHTHDYAASDHAHTGVYEPADETILKAVDIGVDVAAFVHTHDYAASDHDHAGVYEPADATILKDADIGVSVAAQSALAAKVTDADVRGGAASLNARLGCISNFASPNAGGVVVGQYYDNSFQGTASATLAGAANRIDLAPYYTSVTLAIGRIGVAVSTAVASALAKVVIYSSDADGWPDALLYESGNLDCGTTGMKEATLDFTFASGVQYWVGVRHSSTATLRTINVSSAVNLGLTSSSAANYATILRRTVTFANAAPDPWTFTNTDRTANVTPPSIRFRAA